MASLTAAVLRDMGPVDLGHAYAIGAILLGPNTPTAWRQDAKQLRFISERPYFE